MVRALNFDHVRTDHVEIPSDESSFDTILASYLRCYETDLSAYDGVISTKGPTYMVRHPNHICWLLHTIRVFYDMFDSEFPHPWADLLGQRDFIHRADTLALSPPHIKTVFVNGQEVANRLWEFNRVPAAVLYPPLEYDWFQFQNGDGGYAFVPGRLHRWKRLDLPIRAMQHVQAPMELLIAGAGEDETYFRALANGDPRVRFLGKISDAEIIHLYSHATGSAVYACSRGLRLRYPRSVSQRQAGYYLR